jgi:hypothetical protein
VYHEKRHNPVSTPIFDAYYSLHLSSARSDQGHGHPGARRHGRQAWIGIDHRHVSDSDEAIHSTHNSECFNHRACSSEKIKKQYSRRRVSEHVLPLIIVSQHLLFFIFVPLIILSSNIGLRLIGIGGSAGVDSRDRERGGEHVRGRAAGRVCDQYSRWYAKTLSFVFLILVLNWTLDCREHARFKNGLH